MEVKHSSVFFGLEYWSETANQQFGPERIWLKHYYNPNINSMLLDPNWRLLNLTFGCELDLGKLPRAKMREQ